MRPGQHAASDGSFGRSAGIQIGRAVGLIAIAALIGIILLHHNGSTSATTVSAHATTTTAPSHASTTTATTPTTTSAALRPPSSVKVLVANGTVARGTTAGAGTQHLAGTVSTTLHAQGYDTLAAVNATQNVTASIVYFQPGYAREAAVLAQSLTLPISSVQSMPAQPPVPSLNGANILVVAGPDLVRSAAGTTTTTAHAGTATIPTTTIPTTTIPTTTIPTTTIPTTTIPTTTTVHR